MKKEIKSNQNDTLKKGHNKLTLTNYLKCHAVSLVGRCPSSVKSLIVLDTFRDKKQNDFLKHFALNPKHTWFKKPKLMFMIPRHFLNNDLNIHFLNKYF